MKSVKKYFVFDFDETLVDGKQFCGETLATVALRCGAGVEKERLVEFHDCRGGLTMKEMYEELKKEFKLMATVEEMLKMDREIQEKDCHKIGLFDGVKDLLEHLKRQNKRLYICTNRRPETLDLVVKANQIENYFEEIVSCVGRGFKKPDPACLLELIDKNGGNKDEFVYFGDSRVDCDFAKNAGIDFVIFDQYLNEKSLFKKLIHLFA